MKRIKYWLQKFIKEIITCLIVSVGVVLGYIISQQYQLPGLGVLVSVVSIFVGSIITISFIAREKDLYFIPLSRRNDKKTWTGEGIFDLIESQRSFLITNSYWGFIYSKTLVWGDYRLEFDFKILNSCLGVIVRAVSHSDFVMLQIGRDGIRPHVFINGGYRVWEFNETDLNFNDKIISYDDWYECIVNCEDRGINIKILNKSSKEIICDRRWTIPGGAIVFSFREDEADDKPISIPFPINLEYGSFGFRNHGEEKALIKNALIIKI